MMNGIKRFFSSFFKDEWGTEPSWKDFIIMFLFTTMIYFLVILFIFDVIGVE